MKTVESQTIVSQKNPSKNRPDPRIDDLIDKIDRLRDDISKWRFVPSKNFKYEEGTLYGRGSIIKRFKSLKKDVRQLRYEPPKP